jgi:hypothetical protein
VDFSRELSEVDIMNGKAAADGEIYKLQTEEVAQSLLSLRGSID